MYALGQPCPFRGDMYQLMHNVSFAYKGARDAHLAHFAFLVILVDSAPAAHRMHATVEAFRALLLQEHRDRVGLISYEDLADILEDQHDEKALARWTRQRIEQVCGPLRSA